MRALLELARPEQWIKNGFVLLPLIFGQAVGDPEAVRGAILATLAFCLLSSAVYAGNDVVDDHIAAHTPQRPGVGGIEHSVSSVENFRYPIDAGARALNRGVDVGKRGEL